MAENRRKYKVIYVQEVYRSVATAISKHFTVGDETDTEELKKLCRAQGYIYESVGAYKDKLRTIKALNVYGKTLLEAVGKPNVN